MRNSILLAADLSSVAVFKSALEVQPVAINRRGLLINVLGNDVCVASVPAQLESHIEDLLKKTKPFYSYPMGKKGINQLTLSYNEDANTVFIIGITDMDIGFAGPQQVPSRNMMAFAVKLKDSPNTVIASKSVMLVRLEESSGTGQQIRFYYLPL